MHSKSEIIESYKDLWGRVSETILQCSDEEFKSKSSPDVWSIAEEFEHLTKATQVVLEALWYPSLIVKWKFGKPNRPIRTYDECHKRYTDKIAALDGKPKSPEKFTPKKNELNKKQMLATWSKQLNLYEKRISRWSDKSLDNCLLPHPLLGKMMVREMLFFTHFHAEHHAASISKKATLLLQ